MLANVFVPLCQNTDANILIPLRRCDREARPASISVNTITDSGLSNAAFGTENPKIPHFA